MSPEINLENPIVRNRVKRQLRDRAVRLAMENRWEEALEVNLEYQRLFPEDFEVYNRLGKAYAALGRYGEALEAYRKALELDPYNPIATRNVRRLEILLAEAAPPPQPGRARQPVSPRLFIVERGKTTVATLREVADDRILQELAPGDRIQFRIDGERVLVLDSEGTYLGRLEPRLERRLKEFMEGGNRYEGAVVAAEPGGLLRIIIRETYRAPQFARRPSFPGEDLEKLRALLRDLSLPSYVESEGGPYLGVDEEGEEEAEEPDLDELGLDELEEGGEDLLLDDAGEPDDLSELEELA